METTASPSTSSTETSSQAEGSSEASVSTEANNSDGTLSTDTNAEAKSTENQLRELAASDMDAIVTLKINGQIKKVPVKEAIKWAQVNESGYTKFEQAKKMEAQSRELARLAQEDPVQFYKMLGKDPYAIAEDLMVRRIEDLSMTDEQRKFKEYEAKVKSYEEKEALEAKQKAEAEEQASLSKYQTELDNEIAKAFMETKLPKPMKNTYFLQRMAAEMFRASKRGEDLTAVDAAAKVKEELLSGLTDMFESSDDDTMQTLLNDKIRKKFREMELKQVSAKSAQSSPSQGKTPNSQAPAQVSRKKETPMTEREWREWQRSLRG